MPLAPDCRLCAKCIGGDQFLTARMDSDGEDSACERCGKERPTMSIEEIADIVHGVFKKFAVRAEDRYDFSGESPQPLDGGQPPMELLEVELGFPYDVAEGLLVYCLVNRATDLDLPQNA